jgi:hypothetical protein
MRLWDEQKRFLAKVQHLSNRLYVLDLNIAQPMGLVANGADGTWLWHT